MATFIALLLSSIFLFLSMLHFYWGFGGKWATDAVLPTKNENTKVIMPGPIPSFLVAFGLLSFAIITFVSVINLDYNKIPVWVDRIDKYGLRVLAFIFILRAIGDFRYVGFFKKIKNTKFGINDTKIYAPLCLTIGVLALILNYIR